MRVHLVLQVLANDVITRDSPIVAALAEPFQTLSRECLVPVHNRFVTIEVEARSEHTEMAAYALMVAMLNCVSNVEVRFLS